MLSKKWVFFTLLLLVVILHGLVFGSAQSAIWTFSDVFGPGFESAKEWGVLLTYAVATVTALTAQRLCRKIGIKKVVLLGLIANIVGLCLFYLLYLVFHLAGHISYLLFIAGLVVSGFAIASIATVMGTYVIVAFSKYIPVGLVILYSGLNVGISIAGPIFSSFAKANQDELYLVILAVLVAAGIVFISKAFVQPEISMRENEKRKMGLLWDKLKGRLALFIAAMVFYAMIEYTFNLFGYEYIAAKLSAADAAQAVFIFWQALNIGQILIGIPAFWIRPSRVAVVLPLFIILAFVLLPFQGQEGSVVLDMIIGGLGCSAVFPLLLAMLALEVASPRIEESAAELESCSGYMIAAYQVGNGLIILQRVLHTSASVKLYFHIGTAYAIILGLILLYLNQTAVQERE